jgi:hypothetical protein
MMYMDEGLVNLNSDLIFKMVRVGHPKTCILREYVHGCFFGKLYFYMFLQIFHTTP